MWSCRRAHAMARMRIVSNAQEPDMLPTQMCRLNRRLIWPDGFLIRKTLEKPHPNRTVENQLIGAKSLFGFWSYSSFGFYGGFLGTETRGITSAQAMSRWAVIATSPRPARPVCLRHQTAFSSSLLRMAATPKAIAGKNRRI